MISLRTCPSSCRPPGWCNPLADAPGAVTIIDRDLIKASGAREVVDLLRLVPGFQVGAAYSSTPAVAYRGLADEYSRHVQVLVDGRSVYSPYFLGSITWNSLRLSLDDIERIEGNARLQLGRLRRQRLHGRHQHHHSPRQPEPGSPLVDHPWQPGDQRSGPALRRQAGRNGLSHHGRQAQR
ncbi:MAG: Plug domain-containing protein [Rhodocyclaceae bacterium]|nr:Plug domain-containing protein [Rhodocyclaceae bacterium]